MDSSLLTLLGVGLLAGISAGFFGIGGGLIIVPALVYFLGFTQHKATGTSLACLLPPVGIAAVLEYHRKGNVDIKVAAI
ncbi:MAG TPA: TSUP family transporter, partial [Abditibacteriaceae bacterium]